MDLTTKQTIVTFEANRGTEVYYYSLSIRFSSVCIFLP